MWVNISDLKGVRVKMKNIDKTFNQSRRRFLTLIFVLSALFACTNMWTIQENTIDSADAAYNQLNLEQSRMILDAMLESDSLENYTKCNVLRRLAHQDWKYFKNYDLAKSRLMIADSIGISKSKTWNTLSRIERESGNYQNALLASEKAAKYAKSESERTNADMEFAKSVYDFSINNLRNNIPLDKALLTKTSDLLVEILESNAGSPKPSKLLLGISLLQNNGANVIMAWKSYFHILDINNTYSYLASAAKELSDVCTGWQGEKLAVEKQEQLILALSSSRFYEYAGDYAICNFNKKNYSQAVKDVLTYSKYLKTVKNKTNEYYRLIAIGEENENEYRKWLNNTRKELWQNVSFLANKEFSEHNFLNETEKHFGARGFTGHTANYQGYVLCLGHIVNQEKALVEQYGYKPEFTYTQIDMMTSNGYSSWFWEDRAIGGWATDSEIIRVREAYLNGPFDAWKSITDTTEREETETIINEFINQPIIDDIYKQSSALATKLRFDALNDLYNKLYSQGLRGNNLKLAFLSTYENYRIEASILGHEGRHSIEKKYLHEKFKNWSNEEREFHAKLSQIIFSTEPRLELAGMITSISESEHGLANKRIVDIAIDWIKNNKNLIEGFSSDKPIFSQLYLLTNEQIKECYKSTDPLYNCQKTPAPKAWG